MAHVSQDRSQRFASQGAEILRAIASTSGASGMQVVLQATVWGGKCASRRRLGKDRSLRDSRHVWMFELQAPQAAWPQVGAVADGSDPATAKS